MDNTRRTFLKTLGAAAAGVAVGGCQETSEPYTEPAEPEPPLPRIGFQLYTVRDAIEVDAAGALGRVAEMGYTAVETGFWPEGMTVAQAGQLLKDTGLSVFAVHVEIPTEEHQAAVLEAAEVYDCDLMVWHGWPEDERYQTMDGIKELADIYNEAYAFCQANGLQFGLHNHWWEFEPIEDGVLPFYEIRPLIDPGIFFEIDTYWALVAGLDPAEVVRDFGAHAPLLHIKDATVLSTEGPMVAAGSGLQDFPAIAEAGKGHIEWMIVEMDDCETDMFEAAAQSFAYLTENNLARA
ncbi:MAG: sugar phosphate isomerase/epimerase [Bacteroidetes bacterium SB0662_bin_6]|nr:sugar phosphate isomerase/epimerase [Bacteroidetes bacterium SB0668_bin_1]MYE04145.1 sugar phosphate isomerase/epimerase [Bacteroidetes bacterium SB0662_bin_6]